MNSLLITTYRQLANGHYANKCNLTYQTTRLFSENGKINRFHIHKLSKSSTNFGGLHLSTSYAIQQNPYLLTCDLNSYSIRFQPIRKFTLSSSLHEQASSKVEETVKKLQEIERTEKERVTKETTTKSIPVTAETVVSAPVPAPPKAIVPVKSFKQKVWDEIVHYYHGFRLLFIDINVARKLVGKVLSGKTLTRREYRLLIRTTGDVFRLVPFSVFIIVPFMEFLLPVFIKFFPGMLPSTFETAQDREVKARKNLKVKLEMAKFLQKTLDEMDVQHKEHSSEEAKEFLLFFNKIRTTGERATNEEIMKFSKLFEDEITLDSLSRQQLTAICKVLEVGSLGTSNFLRFQLRMKLRSLAADDRMIQRDGIDALTTAELQSACRARGMRAYGLSDGQLKQQLDEWIHLSLNEKVPPSLLLLSRAMMLPENVTTAEKLKASMSVLSDAAAIQTRAAIGEREGKIDNRTQIEIIRDEERKIKEDLEELKEVEKTTVKVDDSLMDKAKVITDDITHKDIEVVFDALSAVSKEKSLIVEKEEIKELKEEIAEYKEDVEELQQVCKQSETKVNVRESPAAKRLLKKVDAMIGKLDKVMEGLENEKKLQELQQLDETKGDMIRIDEVIAAIRKMQKVSDESKVEQIIKLLARIDDDKDGKLKVDDVLKIIEMIGKDNVNLSGKQIDEIVDLIDKEEYLENEEKIQKALAKSKEERDQKQQQKEQNQSSEHLPQFAEGQLPDIDLLGKTDDEKHILQTEKTQLKETKIDDKLKETIPGLEVNQKPKGSSSETGR